VWGVSVEFADGEEGVSPGQACVFYAANERGERLLGGGWIKSIGALRPISEVTRERHAVAVPVGRPEWA
jgi:hypothetical protein